MKRASLIVLALLAAACGATTQDIQNPKSLEVLGPNADGEFYVVGLSSVAPHSDVTVDARSTTTVVSDTDGSFAARVVGEITGEFVITAADGTSTTVHAAAPEKVNVNLASQRGLESLPGIGEARASSIVANRNALGFYAELEDLTRVDGVGEGTVERIREWASVDINLNAATRQQLMALPTIGDVRADAIIGWRNTYGAFKAVEELMNVPGIGTNEYEAIRDFVTVGDVPSDFPGQDLININTAHADLLTELSGIGLSRATAIVDFRDAQGAFVAKEALLYVPGIGPATFDKIRDHITVGVLDVNLGTFLGDAAWTYSYDGNVVSTGTEDDLMVTSHYGVTTGELVLTFVGSAACVESTNCAPVALKGILSDNGDHSFQLLGFLPAGDGNGEFTVAYVSTNAGELSEDTLELSFVAVRGVETYELELFAGRVLQ